MSVPLPQRTVSLTPFSIDAIVACVGEVHAGAFAAVDEVVAVAA
jgi:hypothetical protein